MHMYLYQDRIIVYGYSTGSNFSTAILTTRLSLYRPTKVIPVEIKYIYVMYFRFANFQALQIPLNVTLGDGREVHALGHGDVVLTMNLLHNKLKKCTLHDVLLVPGLAYNLLSVTLASKRGKETKFSEMTCEIRDSKFKVVAIGRREGSLYYLDHGGPTHQAYTGSDQKES